MSWKVAERKIGRAGNSKNQRKRQKEWDYKYGEGQWMIGYVIDGEFISSEEAFDKIYYPSYVEHFKNHPEDLEELIKTAKKLHNPHAEATGGIDLQVPAILQYLRERNLTLLGNELMDIGTWKNEYSHTLSVRLSPLQIKVIGNDKMTLEKYWQEKRYL